MRPLRVLIVTKSTGGVGEYVRTLIQGLDKSLFNITAVCLSEGGADLARQLAQVPGVTALSLAMNRYKMDPLSDARVALALARIMRQGHFDLVHAHASKPGFLTRLAAIGLGVSVIYSPHCFSFHPGVGGFRASVLAFVERLAARYATTRILVVAESEKTLAQKYRVGRPGQFVTVNTGVDLLPFQAPVDREAQASNLGLERGKFTAGCVGRLSDQKAPRDFVRAASLLAQNHPNTQYVWVGDGPLMGEAHALSQALGMDGVMHFAGQRADIPACLAVMDCFVLPSRWEGFPLVVLEAMAAGKPIVATDIEGTNDAVQAEIDGLLVPPGDCQALAGAIERILTDPPLARRLGAAARRKVQAQFTRENMLQRITQVYLSAAGEARQ